MTLRVQETVLAPGKNRDGNDLDTKMLLNKKYMCEYQQHS